MVYAAAHAVNEVGFTLAKTRSYVAGNTARYVLRLTIGVGAAVAGISRSSSFFYATGLLGTATGVGLSAYLNHQEYQHNTQQLADMYHREIGAMLGKPMMSATVQDLEVLAQRNPSIAQQLERERTIRNVKTGVAIACGVIGFVAAAGLVAATVGVGAVGAAPLALKAVGALAGFAAYHLSTPLVAAKLEKKFELDKPSAVELIRDLEWTRTKGHKVSRAQVMNVFLAAAPQMAENIEQKFGKPFMELDLAERERAMLTLGPSVKLDEVTQAINENQINARELTFYMHGQASGVPVDATLKDHFNTQVGRVKEKVTSAHHAIVEKTGRAVNSVHNLVRRTPAEESAAVALEESESTRWRDKEASRRQMQSQTGPSVGG